jgi:hypothetical protein
VIALILEPAGNPEEVSLRGFGVVLVAGQFQGLVGSLCNVGLEIHCGATGRQKGGSKYAGQGSLMNADLYHGRLDILRMIGLVAPD